MAFRRPRQVRPQQQGGYRAKFAKGEEPEWMETPGTLIRAGSDLAIVSNTSQLPGHVTVQPVGPNSLGRVVARKGSLGIYLGKKRVERRDRDHGNVSVSIPTFWLGGCRVTTVTVKSFDQIAVAVEEEGEDDGGEG